MLTFASPPSATSVLGAARRGAIALDLPRHSPYIGGVQELRRSRMRALSVVFASFASCFAACRGDVTWSGDLGRGDFAAFEAEVYPVLMRDCGFANCHGVEQRAFQVWGPGRSRLDTNGDIIAAEHLRTYARALSMLYTDGSRPLSESPLLTKPLEISAGGATHAGVDRYGRNVYRTQNDPGFQVIWRWAVGAAAAPSGSIAGSTAPSSGIAGSTAPSGGIAGSTAPSGSVVDSRGAP